LDKTADGNDVLVSLRLDMLQLKDAGQIQVQARNLLGDVSSMALLTVKGKLILLIRISMFSQPSFHEYQN